jgi:tetratricopeptide (TPR) repeat protein
MRAISILSVLLAGAIALAAPPNPERAKARVLYESATTHYNLSEYADALKDFKEAYRLVKDPVLLFNIAQCQRQLKEYEEAQRLFRAYLREYPDANNREEVVRLINQMDELIAQKRNQAPPAVTPVASPAPEAVPPPPVAANAALTAAPAEAPPKKRKWVWGVVGGVVAAAVIVGVTVGVVFGTEKSEPPKLPDVRF